MSGLDLRPDDLAIVDLRQQPGSPLLEQAYRGLYLESFPQPEEQEDPGIWAPALWQDDGAGMVLHFLVAGHELDSDDSQIAALATCEYYPASGCGLLGYLAVAPRWRRQGLGRRLLGARRAALRRTAAAQGATLQAVFAEIHDPQLVAGDDVMDPRARAEVMHRLGGRRLPLPYVQPDLGHQAGRARDLMLVAFAPAEGPALETLAAEVAVAFVAELYAELGIEDVAADPDFIALCRGAGSGELALAPLV